MTPKDKKKYAKFFKISRARNHIVMRFSGSFVLPKCQKQDYTVYWYRHCRKAVLFIVVIRLNTAFMAGIDDSGSLLHMAIGEQISRYSMVELCII